MNTNEMNGKPNDQTLPAHAASRFKNQDLCHLVKKIVADSCLSTTAHGLPNIVRAESWPLRLVWVVCLLASSGYCIYTTVNMVLNFISMPVITTVTSVNELPTQFPTVMICNANPFNMSSDSMKAIEDNASKLTIPGRYPYSNLLAMQIKLKANIYSNISASRDPEAYGNRLSKMLLYCRSRTVQCDETWFEWVYEFDYVNCYKFNTNGSLKIGKTGSSYGLQLELYIGNSSSQEPYTESRGLRIAIYNSSVNNPFIYDQGYDVHPGVVTNIEVRKSFNERLGPPYSNCLDDLTNSSSGQSDFMKLAFERMNQTQYNQIYCQNVCLQSAVIEKCKCYFLNLPLINTTVRKCTDLSPLMVCYNNVLTNFSIDPTAYCQDKCPDPCSTQSFDTYTSQSQYLANWYWNEQKNFYSSTSSTRQAFGSSSQLSVYETVSAYDVDQARNNIVRLNIFFQYLGYTLISESPLYTVDSFLANVGGNLGLFVGTSLLSFMEVFEVVYLIIYSVCGHLINQSKHKRRAKISHDAY